MGMSAAGSREINVTPLIDVLLVLLIIFLVMMPIMLRSETVELPPHVGDVTTEGRVIELKLAADLSIALDDGPAFANSELPARLRPRVTSAKAIFVNFVDGIPWGQVISTVDTIRGVANSNSRTDLAVAVRLHDDARGL
ncbi:MAG TPA: biopolymer transporter ExbD [Kofleriaceae bacterium]|nr:biopolymer transporter ExbD [Kofleriaceae bacterium]